MKVTFEDEEKTITIEFKCLDVVVDNLLEVLLNMLTVYGYHPESIKRSVIELAKEYSREKDEEQF